MEIYRFIGHLTYCTPHTDHLSRITHHQYRAASIWIYLKSIYYLKQEKLLYLTAGPRQKIKQGESGLSKLKQSVFYPNILLNMYNEKYTEYLNTQYYT